MRKKWIWIGFLAPIGIALFIFVGGEVVMRLWNWLAPMLFGWRLITFWQAVGLLALCRILFGSHGGRRFRRFNSGGRMFERWEQMTPEERERLRHGIRSRCGGVPPPTGSSAPAAS